MGTQDKDVVENYYKDNNALFTVTVDEQTRLETVNAIRKLIGDENSMSGSAVNTAVATQATNSEIKKIILLVLPICLEILCITSHSWIEPILLLGTIGVAIILNKGTNLMFGSISFVTNAAGGVLQLAVSMDYSIFLLHRFEEMRAITLSLITVFVLFPVILLYFYPLIDKTRHKYIVPDFEKFSKVVMKVMLPAVIVFFILIVPCNLAQKINSFSYGSSKLFSENTQIGRDTKKIDSIFGKSNNLVLMVPKGDLQKETELSDKLHEIPELSSIISYVDSSGAEVPGVLSQLGHLLGRGTVLSTIIVLFVIPGMLYIFDTLIRKTTVGANFYEGKPEKKKSEKREIKEVKESY